MKTFMKKFLEKTSSKRHLVKASSKAQTALEYLMTYGWAVIIVAIVFVILVHLNLLTPPPPTAIPGSCQVVKTVQGTQLLGVCSGVLPKYVAQFNQSGGFMNLSYFGPPGVPITITAWMRTYTSGGQIVEVGRWWSPEAVFLYPSGAYTWNGFCCQGGSQQYYIPLPPLSEQWYFVAFTLNSSGGIALWLNGTLVGANQMGGPLSGRWQMNYYPLYIGGGGFYGDIANVQIYTTALSANEIERLYREGIGGAPIDLGQLDGWWPLNGDADDYSGNENNCQIYGPVTFVSNWETSYTPP